MGTETEGHRALVVPVDGPVREVVLPVQGSAVTPPLRDALREHAGARQVGFVARQLVATGDGRRPWCPLAVWADEAEERLLRPLNERVSFMLSHGEVEAHVYGDVVITGSDERASEQTAADLPAAAVEALLARWST